MKKIYVIGAGGVGSWLAPSICLLAGSRHVTIIDGDKLEKGNLNRQLFSEYDVGDNKAYALAQKYQCGYEGKYYSHGLFECDSDDIFLVCVDNNPARVAVLESCDAYGCMAIFGSNEVTSAEAYVYMPEWAESNHDPRWYYPEIATDKRFDPRRIGTGCTGEAQENNKQLVSANFMAAALMQHLYVLWVMEVEKFNTEAKRHIPYRINQNLSKYEVKTLNTQENKNE